MMYGAHAMDENSTAIAAGDCTGTPELHLHVCDPQDHTMHTFQCRVGWVRVGCGCGDVTAFRATIPL